MKKPPKVPVQRYPLALLMLQRLRADVVAEFKFHPVRRWRSDYALPTDKILIEIDGGVWSGGRHTRGAGFIADQQKHNAAAVMGYRTLRFTPADIGSGYFLKTVRETITPTPEGKDPT